MHASGQISHILLMSCHSIETADLERSVNAGGSYALCRCTSTQRA